MENRLRNFVSEYSPEISDSELEEVESLINFDEYYNDYEYSGNFIGVP